MIQRRSDLAGADDLVAELALARRALLRHLADDPASPASAQCGRPFMHPRRPTEFDAVGHLMVDACACLRACGHDRGCLCAHGMERVVYRVETTGASTTRRYRFDERQGGAGAVGEEAMKTDQLKKNVGQDLYLRPYPLIVQYAPNRLSTGLDPVTERRLVQTDYLWRLVAVNGGVTLRCHHTNHEVTLGADNVREFRTPHFLLLRCQLTLDGDRVHILAEEMLLRLTKTAAHPPNCPAESVEHQAGYEPDDCRPPYSRPPCSISLSLNNSPVRGAHAPIGFGVSVLRDVDIEYCAVGKTNRS